MIIKIHIIRNLGLFIRNYFNLIFIVLSSVIKNYDVCDPKGVDITDSSAFISSPNFPTFTVASNECTRRIRVPDDKILNIWLTVDVRSSDSGGK